MERRPDHVPAEWWDKLPFTDQWWNHKQVFEKTTPKQQEHLIGFVKDRRKRNSQEVDRIDKKYNDGKAKELGEIKEKGSLLKQEIKKEKNPRAKAVREFDLDIERQNYRQQNAAYDEKRKFDQKILKIQQDMRSKSAFKEELKEMQKGPNSREFNKHNQRSKDDGMEL